MQTYIYIKGIKEPIIYSGDRIDILDYESGGVVYKQIRCFKKGFSKSELIDSKLINKIIEK